MLKIGKIINEPTMIVESGTYVTPYYIVTEELDTTLYVDITSNVNWMNIVLNSYGYDYLYCRLQVKIRTATLGFDNLNDDDKKCASKHFVVSKENRNLVHSEIEQKRNWDTLINITKKNRLERWVNAKSYISYILSPIDSTDLALNTETLSKNYVEYGIESLATHGVNGLYDWLNSTYTEKTYYNEIHKEKIISILSTGIV